MAHSNLSAGFICRRQVERFLGTENAALISMHYPQAQREVHFGTAPFHKGAETETGDVQFNRDEGEQGDEQEKLDSDMMQLRGARGTAGTGEKSSRPRLRMGHIIPNGWC